MNWLTIIVATGGLGLAVQVALNGEYERDHRRTLMGSWASQCPPLAFCISEASRRPGVWGRVEVRLGRQICEVARTAVTELGSEAGRAQQDSQIFSIRARDYLQRPRRAGGSTVSWQSAIAAHSVIAIAAEHLSVPQAL